ncbi:enolase C-terminal domain-like protein [Pseudonocardia kunmingensis]|uniref:L-alanine-DL-glutamate epimerase-like enolase superfamily enzyme n=1 Tax=Pseudonocardia kunmingensis TaxID=630975 RepID=A0A543DK42_9PSEU|nr:enolase C-terminal domain-like protein [Pseudonocardia kunmingensis]TQM09700.1 L-alanine-DL-glutamate epimerase-like enolase superfamily enzyme [Pseudonocardia kunmingensis]
MARIDRVEVTSFSVELRDFARRYTDDAVAGSLVYSPGALTRRPALLTRIHTEDGHVGEFAYWARPDTVEQAIDAARIAVGRHWHSREQIYRVARRQARPKHSYGLSWIDNALWDLAGKAWGASLTEMLGGFRTTIPCYVSCHNGDRLGSLSTKESVAEFFGGLQHQGVRGFKMHSWHEGDKWEEAENVAYLRSVLGDRTELMLDPACVFDSVSDAIFVGKAAQDAGFKWYEDPLRPLGVGAFPHKQLREALDIPILQTEHVPGPEAKADFLLGGGTDLLRVDAQLDLGVTGCLRTIKFAEALGVNVEVHGPSPVHRHLIAAMQNTTWYEIANTSPAMSDPSPAIYTCGYDDDLASIAADGTVAVPSGPGIGVEYDTELIEKQILRSQTVTASDV